VVRLLDDVMPAYDVYEHHELWVPAPPEEAYAALKAVSAREVRLFDPLMRLRTFGRSGRVFDPETPLLEQMLRIGFLKLGERPSEEIVVGAIGRFWSPTGNRPRATADFAGFAEPGFAKAAMNFAVRSDGDGSRITTETRVLGTDPSASRKFRAYWVVIRPASGAIRRSWLRAIRRRLERTPGDTAHEAR
jgi:hypothetical protein